MCFLWKSHTGRIFCSLGVPGGANHVSERSENIIFEKFGTCRTFFIPLASLSDENQRVCSRSKKVTFQSDSCLVSGFSQVCVGLKNWKNAKSALPEAEQ